MPKIWIILELVFTKIGHLTGLTTFFRLSWGHLRSVWWLQSLSVFIIAIIIFTVLIQTFRTPGVSPDNLADTIYNFFNDWAIVLGASVTLLLASAAFLAILDNRHSKVVDRKERYINEIIEWAQDIQHILHDTNPDTYILRGKELVSMLLNTCKKLQSRSSSILYIADVLDKDLKDAIQNTSIKLDSCTDACSKFLLTQEGPQLEGASRIFVKLAVATTKSTDEIISQATNIKISLLS